MSKIISHEELTKLMGTDNMSQFEESVLIRNIITVYPESKDITLHNDQNGDLIAMIVMY